MLKEEVDDRLISRMSTAYMSPLQIDEHRSVVHGKTSYFEPIEPTTVKTPPQPLLAMLRSRTSCPDALCRLPSAVCSECCCPGSVGIAWGGRYAVKALQLRSSGGCAGDGSGLVFDDPA
jgi:hypothetical protein